MGNRVLIVDDDLLVAMSIACSLEDLGYETCDASSADEALHLIRHDPGIAVVLTDLHMPGLDGYQFADRLRVMRPDLPVILVTGDPRVPPGREALPTLCKPHTRLELGAMLANTGATRQAMPVLQ